MIDIEKFIPQKQVINRTSLSGTSIWRLIQKDEFPRSYKIGPNRVAWLKSDIDGWIAEKVDTEC